MLEQIASLEGAAEHLPPGRESSVVRTKLQEARLAELERLRTSGAFDRDRAALDDAMSTMETALARGRQLGLEAILSR
jgi:hypothetical protein